MNSYLNILKDILKHGNHKPSRTGVDTISMSGVQFKHNMEIGFPILTTKFMALRQCAVELEFFIKGLSSKKWLQQRKVNIWNDWCNPQKVPYSADEETKTRMHAEDDLGRIYGVQWRKWRGVSDHDGDYDTIDQLQNVINTLKVNPLDRRMLVTAWNPAELDEMAIPPCHYAFQCLSDGTYLDLIWIQRSVDTPIGLPYDINLYGLLLLLLAKESDLKPRYLIGQLGDVHIYQNQLDGVKEQLGRQPMTLPEVEVQFSNEHGINGWTSEDFTIKNYYSHPRIKYPIAV